MSPLFAVYLKAFFVKEICISRMRDSDRFDSCIDSKTFATLNVDSSSETPATDFQFLSLLQRMVD